MCIFCEDITVTSSIANVRLDFNISMSQFTQGLKGEQTWREKLFQFHIIGVLTSHTILNVNTLINLDLIANSFYVCVSLGSSLFCILPSLVLHFQTQIQFLLLYILQIVQIHIKCGGDAGFPDSDLYKFRDSNSLDFPDSFDS